MDIVALIEIAGALLILAGFAASQLRRLDAHSTPYLLLNITGAGALAAVAAVHASWGFLLLEGVWTIVSAVSLVSALSGRWRRPHRSAEGTAAAG